MTALVDEKVSALESSIGGLGDAIHRLEERVAVLEAEAYHEVALAGPLAEEPSHDLDLSRGVALVGRTLLVLAGGYLFRAVTAAGVIPAAVGVGLGLLYALTWVVLADRAGGRGRPLDAAFHALAAALVGFPLVWETTVAFGVLAPEVGASALALLSAALLAVTYRRRLRALAWIAATATLITAPILVVGTRAVVPFAWVLVGLGAALLWLSRRIDLPVLPWIAEAAAGLAVVVVTLGSVSSRSQIPLDSAAPVQIALVLLFAGGLVWMTLSSDRDLGPIEVVQIALATVVGFGGAVIASTGQHADPLPVGLVGMVLGAGAYALAFTRVRRERRTLLSTTSFIGFTLLLVGSFLVLPDPAAPWSAAAVTTAWLGRRFGRLSLELHAGLFAIAAAVASGLAMHSLVAFAARPPVAWPPWDVRPWIALLATACALALASGAENRFWRRWNALPRFLLLLVFALGTGGLLVRALASTIPTGGEAGTLSVVRTGVLALAASALAWSFRRRNQRATAWAAALLFAAGGIKVVLEDFPAGSPVSLVLSLALYGGALIVAARWAQGTARSS